tara:strand:+ start:182 stop:799 length:618 start_codon:yes stop_codon:yes gene_type:complete
MGVLKKEKIIFCHISKNAGQTVHKIMREIGDLQIDDRHYNLFQIKQILKDDNFFDKCKKFCVVRNPWDRMVSTYFFRKKMKEFDFGPIKQWDLDFNSWVKYIYSDEYKKLKLMAQGTLNNVRYHYGNSIDWIKDRNSIIMDCKVIRFENIETELKDLFNELGYEINISKNNSTSHKPYQNYYNEESKKLVEKNFNKDINIFNYKF